MIPGVTHRIVVVGHHPHSGGEPRPPNSVFRKIRQVVIAGELLMAVLFPSALPANHPFRFAWVSDTHVGSNTGMEDLCATVRDINGQRDISFTIVSGDITEIGSDEELILAKSIFDSLSAPYHIIPGNHDTKWSASGCTMFAKLWGSDRFAFRHEGIECIGLHEGPIMRMGDGHFAPEDLRWLDSLVADPNVRRAPIIFVTHYPLDASIDNWYEALDRLQRLDTRVVLCGHGHANRVLDFEGVPALMGRSNLRAKNQPGGYTIVELRTDSLVATERLPSRGTSPEWHRMSFAPRHTEGSGIAHPRPVYTINNRYSTVAVRWTFSTDFTITAGPALCGNRIIVCDRSGSVVCLSSTTGALLWRLRVGGPVLSTPDVTQDLAVLAAADGAIYAVDAVSGRIVWRFQTAKPIVAAPRIVGDLVLVGGSDSTFRALKVKDGSVEWEYRGVGGFVESRPLVYRGNVIFGAWDTHLYSLRLSDGTLEWKWSNGIAARLFSPAACWPVAADGKVFIVAPDRAMTAIDAETGATVWRTTAHQVREAVGISLDSSRVYARCTTDTLLAFSSTSSTPKLLWNAACGYGYDIDPSMPIERDGVVYFGTKNGLVVAVNAAAGTLRWIYKVGVTIINTPAPSGENGVVVTDLDGKVTMLVER
jgi:outer membrane protein assembly factor BamB